MDRSTKLDRWLSWLANIGVIAGIVFLALEIRLNTEMIRSQTRDSITEKQLTLFEWFATDAENIRIREAGDKLELKPESVEFAQYAWMIAGNFRLWENEWYQYQQGLFEPNEFQPRINIWRRMLNDTPGMRHVWEEYQGPGYAPDFRELIDSLIEDQQK